MAALPLLFGRPRQGFAPEEPQELWIHAAVVIFDPAKNRDHATFDDLQQLATGVLHVLVGGTPVLRDGEPTGATPGRVVRGPGWSGW